MEKIAVIVPFYNDEKYFKECVDSVLSQDYDDFVLVLVNDGSSDGCYDMAKQYIKSDSRIVLMTSDNRGLGCARNLGLEYVCGEHLSDEIISEDGMHCVIKPRVDTLVPFADFTYNSTITNIGGGGILEHSKSYLKLYSCNLTLLNSLQNFSYFIFLDSDDYFKPGAIAIAVDSMRQSKADIVWYGSESKYEDDLEDNGYDRLQDYYMCQDIEKNIYTPSQFFENIKSDSFSCANSAIYRMSLAHLRFCPYIESEDALYGMCVFASCQRIKIIQDKLFVYRFRAGSISGHTGVYDKEKFSKFLYLITDSLQTGHEVKHYRFAFSCAIISRGVLDFIAQNSIDGELREQLLRLIYARVKYAFGALAFPKDPLNTRKLLRPLLPYSQQADYKMILLYKYPFLQPIYQSIRRLKAILKKLY